MSDNTTDPGDLKRRLLAILTDGFPVSSAPYCDLATHLGLTEVEVLNAVVEMRETGTIARIAARLADDAPPGFCSALDPDEQPGTLGDARLTCEEAELLGLLVDDLPWSERPYAEIAAMLQMRGYDVDEAWVLEHIVDWTASAALDRPRVRDVA